MQEANLINVEEKTLLVPTSKVKHALLRSFYRLIILLKVVQYSYRKNRLATDSIASRYVKCETLNKLFCICL